ncbi:MAG: ABC transporter permease subunit [Acidilobaceae archaeon]|nr:ABC transporter permease subunit [Acidilobaceae archaeon]
MDAFRLAGLSIAAIMTLYVLALLSSLPANVGPGDLLDLLSTPRFRYALFVSVITSLFASLLSMSVAVPLGYMLSRGLVPGKLLVDSLSLVLLALPPISVGILILATLSMEPLRSIDRQLGIIYNLPAIVLAQFTVEIPVVLRLSREVFDYVEKETEEILMTMGATRLRTFLEAALPTALPGLLATFVVAYFRAFGEFGATLIVSGQIPFRTETLPILMLKEMEASLGRGLAVVTVVVAITLLAVTIVIYLREKSFRP